MSQNIFKNPEIISNPVLQPGAIGNGTLTINKLTHFTVAQVYTAVCTAIAPFTVFKVVGSLDGPVGTATVGTQFYDRDLKVFFTIVQGPTLFAIGDTFEFEVGQGTDLTQENIDSYDELPQKNFSAGVEGTNSGDDNVRFTDAAKFAHAIVQNLAFTAKDADELGDEASIEYLAATVLTKASLTVQDLKYEADTAGAAGNGISLEYEDWTQGSKAFVQIQNIKYEALAYGVAGNAISVEYFHAAGPISVAVVGQAIQVTFESGVAIVDDIKSAVNVHPVAGTMVTALPVGGSQLFTQTAPEAQTFLAGGVDHIGDAGNEVVSVVGQAVKVKLQSGVSTATQVKSKVDAYPAAAALVDTTIVGVGSNPQTAPSGPTNLSGGYDDQGLPGFEVVTVVAKKISVMFQSGNSTATQVRTAILNNVDAAALVDVAVIGAGGSVMQTSPFSRKFLGGGSPADTYQDNSNEISDPTNFHEGNANSIVKDSIVQGKQTVIGNSTLRRLLALDDLDAIPNGSGPSIANVQQYLNHLMLISKIIVTTVGQKLVWWKTPDLTFTSDIKIYFKDTGKTNTIVASGLSPITIADGESVYVTLDKDSNSNLTPTVASAIPHGTMVFRLVSRVGTHLVWFNQLLQNEHEHVRLGSNIDYRAHTFKMIEDGGTITKNDLSGRVEWDADLKIKILGTSIVITVPPSVVYLADDEVAYVDLDDPVVAATKTIQKKLRTDDDLYRIDRFWLFHKSGDKVYMRDGGNIGGGGGGGASGTLFDERPAGASDGSNRIYTLSYDPADPESVVLLKDGQPQLKSTYTVVGLTITVNIGSEFQYGQIPHAIYARTAIGGNTSGKLQVYGTKAAPIEVDETAGLGVYDYARQLHFVKSDGGAQVVSANPQIGAGTTVGQELIIIGTSDTNYLVFNDGNGLSLNGSWSSLNYAALYLFWDGSNWCEISRR